MYIPHFKFFCRNYKLGGLGLSKQSWALIVKLWAANDVVYEGKPNWVHLISEGYQFISCSSIVINEYEGKCLSRFQ